MQPGPELDALIAEKVMGWKREDRGPGYGIYWNTEATGDPLSGYEPFVSPPRYSTDISAAWQVVEKMREAWFLSLADSGGSFQVTFYEKPMPLENADYNGRVYMGRTEQATTAPHAICLAALKAVGAEVLA